MSFEREKHPVEPFTPRRCSTLEGDESENLGVYLVLDGIANAGWSLDHGTLTKWRYLILVEDSDGVGDVCGEIRTDSSGWLLDWTEPMAL